jgi:predicted alpha/beta hydrolase
MDPRPFTVHCDDRYPLNLQAFVPDAARSAVCIAPALGVPSRFYLPFASFLAGRGFATTVFDYRGSGASTGWPQRGRDMRMEHWGRLDIDAVLGWIRRELKPRRLFLVGHSAGAQLPGLAAESEKLDAMVCVAGSAPHLRHYPLRFWPTLATTLYVLGPLLSTGRDRFPAQRTGLGTTSVAAGVVAQWCRWARSRDYLFDRAHGLDTSRYARLSLPILSYCFHDDSYATPAATDALLQRYSAARIERRLVERPAQGVIGHFGFFRDRFRDTLWRETADWLEQRL